MAHKKGLGSSRNGRDSNPKYLGVKVFAGQRVGGGEIIVRQRGTRFRPGDGTGLGRDHTIFATRAGRRRVQDRSPRPHGLGRRVAELALGSPDHVEKNRAYWERESDAYQKRHAEQLAENAGPRVGRVADPGGGAPGARGRRRARTCSSSAAARRSGRSRSPGWARGTVGLDLSPRQLEHARTAMAAAGVEFPLVEASAEDVPLEDETFDVVFCDHGAFNFADPTRLCRSARGCLRTGGLLAFSMLTPVFDVFWDNEREAVGRRAAKRLLRASWLRGRRGRRLPAALWRVDPALSRQRLRRRGPDRAAPAAGRDVQLRHRAARMGAPHAGRAHLEGAQADRLRRDRPGTASRRRPGGERRVEPWPDCSLLR